jgi:hypothetical protein
MPIDLKNGDTLHCPDCHGEIKVAMWGIGRYTHFCKCRGSICEDGWTEQELEKMVKEQGGQ